MSTVSSSPFGKDDFPSQRSPSPAPSTSSSTSGSSSSSENDSLEDSTNSRVSNEFSQIFFLPVTKDEVVHFHPEPSSLDKPSAQITALDLSGSTATTPKKADKARRGSLPLAAPPELREDTKAYIRIEQSNQELVQISKEKQKILQKIIDLTNPNEFYPLAVELGKVLHKEGRKINERLALLGQKPFSEGELNYYISSRLEKERENFEYRMHFFAKSDESEERSKELCRELIDGGTTTFDKWMQILLEANDSKKKTKAIQYIDGPLSELVKEARKSEKCKKLLKDLILHAYGRVPLLSWQECPVEEVYRASNGIALLCRAIREASKSKDVVGDVSDPGNAGNERESRKFVEKRDDWEHWVKEIWDSVTKEHGEKFKLISTIVILSRKQGRNPYEKAVIDQKTHAYSELCLNPPKAFVAGDAEKINFPNCIYGLDENIVSHKAQNPISGELISASSYAKQVYDEIVAHQEKDFDKLSEERVVLKERLYQLRFDAINEMRKGGDLEKLISEYRIDLLRIHAAMVNNYKRLQRCRPLEIITKPPALQNLYTKKNLFQAYVNYAMEYFFENKGDISLIVKAIEFAQDRDTGNEAIELLSIIKRETDNLGIYDSYEIRGKLWGHLRKAEEKLLEKGEVEEKLLEKRKETDKDLPIRRQDPEDNKSRSKRREGYEVHVGKLQKNLLTRFNIEMLRQSDRINPEDLKNAEGKVFKVGQFEKEKLWKRADDPKRAEQRDQEMHEILNGEQTKEVGNWIKQGQLGNIDNLVDYALSNVISGKEIYYSQLEQVLQGGVKRALRNWKGKLFRSGRIGTIMAMMQRIKERADIEKWKHIEDPSYAKFFDNLSDRMIAAIKRGVEEALPNKHELDDVIKRLFLS